MKLLVENTWQFEKEVARLNKRAHKVGLDLITFQNLGQKTVTQTRVAVLVMDGQVSQEQERNVPVNVTEYEITLPSAEDYRWTLAARLEPMEDGTLFVDSKLKGFDRSRWEKANPCHCDHCKTNRRRSLTYVVRNKDDGRELQVGRNCFADYVGHEGLMKLEFLEILVSTFGDGGDDDFIFPGGSARQTVVAVRNVIAVAELMAERDGWKNNVMEFGEVVAPGTHRIAARFVTDRPAGIEFNKDLQTRLENKQDSIWAKVDGILARLQSMEPSADDDFATSLCYCAQFEVVPVKKASLVAYSGQFLRNADRRAALEAKKLTMTHVGTVGERTVFKGLTCRKIVSFDSQFGTTYIHIFEDAQGNELVWKTGKGEINEGETVSLKATVKEHNERNGAKQTIITRCVVQP